VLAFFSANLAAINGVNHWELPPAKWLAVNS
jgi:hypothetical protein